MPKFLVQASYSTDGVKGLLKEGGSDRRATVETTVVDDGAEVTGVAVSPSEPPHPAMTRAAPRTSPVRIAPTETTLALAPGRGSSPARTIRTLDRDVGPYSHRPRASTIVGAPPGRSRRPVGARAP